MAKVLKKAARRQLNVLPVAGRSTSKVLLQPSTSAHVSREEGTCPRRKAYGGTRSLGFKRGSIVRHPKYGTAYVGGTTGDKFLAFGNWRMRLLPGLKSGVPAA